MLSHLGKVGLAQADDLPQDRDVAGIVEPEALAVLRITRLLSDPRKNNMFLGIIVM